MDFADYETALAFVGGAVVALIVIYAEFFQGMLR